MINRSLEKMHRPSLIQQLLMGSFIWYPRKIFKKFHISHSLICKCAYQGEGNVSFLENFGYLLRDRTFSRQGEGESQRVFVVVMKCFRHISMGHEIFFKNFDRSQIIFLCSVFVLLFFKLRRLEHKISKLAIKEI